MEMQQHQQEADKRIDERGVSQIGRGQCQAEVGGCSTMGKFMMPTLSCPT